VEASIVRSSSHTAHRSSPRHRRQGSLSPQQPLRHCPSRSAAPTPPRARPPPPKSPHRRKRGSEPTASPAGSACTAAAACRRVQVTHPHVARFPCQQAERPSHERRPDHSQRLDVLLRPLSIRLHHLHALLRLLRPQPQPPVAGGADQPPPAHSQGVHTVPLPLPLQPPLQRPMPPTGMSPSPTPQCTHPTTSSPPTRLMLTGSEPYSSAQSRSARIARRTPPLPPAILSRCEYISYMFICRVQTPCTCHTLTVLSRLPLTCRIPLATSALTSPSQHYSFDELIKTAASMKSSSRLWL
jgi:hypothetical protein